MNQGALVLDIRKPEEFAKGHIEGALNIPVQILPQRLADVGPGHATLEWDTTTDHAFPTGDDGWIVHGGMVTALLDTAMGQSTWTLLNHGEVFLTANLHTEFYRPTVPGLLRAVGRVEHHRDARRAQVLGLLLGVFLSSQIIGRGFLVFRLTGSAADLGLVYFVMVLRIRESQGWSVGETLLILLASALPFGGFWAGRHLK